MSWPLRRFRQIDDSRKTAVIDHELQLGKLGIDIAALQETRLPSNGYLKQKDYTFIWQGKEPQELSLHGVDFAVKNSLLPNIILPSGGSSCILSLHLSPSSGELNILNVYVPTICSTAETKDNFYLQSFSPSPKRYPLLTICLCLGISMPMLEVTQTLGPIASVIAS